MVPKHLFWVWGNASNGLRTILVFLLLLIFPISLLYLIMFWKFRSICRVLHTSKNHHQNIAKIMKKYKFHVAIKSIALTMALLKPETLVLIMRTITILGTNSWCIMKNVAFFFESDSFLAEISRTVVLVFCK